ncbi:MAG: 3-oxoacyl-ACP reductase family protein [Acidobacteriota bacterium]
MKLTGKVALITGGGTGMGRAIALKFAREGAAVVINYSKSEMDAAKTSSDVKTLGAPSSTILADVSSDQQVRTMVAKVEQEYGRLDILVNNAGYTRFITHSDLETLSEAIWDRILAVNVKGTFFCSRAVAPIMKRQGWGRIINISSVAGLTAGGSSIAYCASKAAVISLTKTLARALAPEILVNSVAPGLIETRWLNDAPDPEGVRARQRENAPLHRVGTPDDVAEVTLSLACDWSFVTGQIVVVDGGRNL